MHKDIIIVTIMLFLLLCAHGKEWDFSTAQVLALSAPDNRFKWFSTIPVKRVERHGSSIQSAFKEESSDVLPDFHPGSESAWHGSAPAVVPC